MHVPQPLALGTWGTWRPFSLPQGTMEIASFSVCPNVQKENDAIRTNFMALPNG